MQPVNNSHLGVYGLILNPDSNKLLVIKKSLGCYTGLYDLPGGGLDDGELLEDALRREIHEETGCTVISCTQAGTLGFIYPYQRNGQQINLRHIGIIYIATVTGQPLSTPAGGDSAGCVWLPISDITSNNTSPLVIDGLALIQSGGKGLS